MDVAVRMSVPATSANLGPGFDTLGLALAFHDEYEIYFSAGSGCRIEVEGEGAADVPRNEKHLVVHAMRHVCDAYQIPLPRVELRAKNRIPHGRGMGSSAAAIVSGVLAIREYLAQARPKISCSIEDAYSFATQIEGHPDNVAPSMFGGATVAWMSESANTDGAIASEPKPRPRAQRLNVHPMISPLVVVPDFRVSTARARTLRPDRIPYEDAVFNLSRSSLLVVALTQSPHALFEATEDRLHQSYRQPVMPESFELVQLLRKEGFPAVVSGAGPSVLVLANGSEQRMYAQECVSRLRPEWTQHALAVNAEGAICRKLS